MGFYQDLYSAFLSISKKDEAQKEKKAGAIAKYKKIYTEARALGECVKLT